MNSSSAFKTFIAYSIVTAIIGYGFYSFASDTFLNFQELDEGITYSTNNDPSISKTFNMSSGNLDVMTSGGRITTEGHAGSKVVVEAFVKQNGKVLAASDKLMSKLEEGFDMRIEKSGSTVYAHAKRKGNSMPWKRMSVAFHVKVPHDMACTLKTSGGSIKLSEVNGDQKVRTSGGSITVTDVDGELDAHTSGGSITLKNIEGNVEGYTSGGRINLENVEGDEVEVKTSGGSISISGSARSVSASTSGGSIKANITGLSNKLHLSTSGGSIHAEVPDGLGMDLDLKGNSVRTDLKNFSGTSKKNYVQGSMNGGGMPVTMRTSGGSVTLSFQ